MSGPGEIRIRAAAAPDVQPIHAMIVEPARITIDRGYPRMESNALDWNELALEFYADLGAVRIPEWDLHRLDGDPLRRVAGV